MEGRISLRLIDKSGISVSPGWVFAELGSFEFLYLMVHETFGDFYGRIFYDYYLWLLKL
jgi:hypothetical protein